MSVPLVDWYILRIEAIKLSKDIIHQGQNLSYEGVLVFSHKGKKNVQFVPTIVGEVSTLHNVI